MWLTWLAMCSSVPATPAASILRSCVTSNCRIAEPNWNPCVHSVQPREV